MTNKILYGGVFFQQKRPSRVGTAFLVKNMCLTLSPARRRAGRELSLRESLILGTPISHLCLANMGFCKMIIVI